MLFFGMKFCYFVTYCYFLFSFGLNPCKNSKFAHFCNLILSLLVLGVIFGSKKNSIVLSQNHSFEELMEGLIFW